MTPDQHDMLQNPEDFSAVREFFTSERKDGMKTIEELAREAGIVGMTDHPAIQRFAALVRAQAMEEAAVICEATVEQGAADMHCETKAYASAVAIRAAAQEPWPTAPTSSSAG